MRTANSGEHRGFSWDEGTGTPVQTAEVPLLLTTDLTRSDEDGLTEDDAVLVRRSRAGDSAAFAALYHRHAAAVRTVCRRHARDADTVDDLVQETFSRLWAALPTFTGGDKVEHWLRRTAKNLSIDEQRRHRNSEVPLVAAMVDRATVNPDPAEPAVTRHAVRGVLAQLRPADAALLREHHLADRPLREMAARWKSTEKSLSVRLTRARRAFALAGSDLRGLLPVPLWWRLRWASRSESVGVAGTAGAMGAVNVALAVLLTLPAAAAATEAIPAEARQPKVSGSAVARPDRGAAERPVRRAPTTRAGNSAEHQSRQPAVDNVAPPPKSTVVEVRDAGVRVHRDVPDRIDYRYQVDVSVGPVTDPGLGMHRSPRTEPVNEPACEAVATAPAAVTCTKEE